MDDHRKDAWAGVLLTMLLLVPLLGGACGCCG